jgi:D-alanyl-D-alanine carboxypeptidase (penicillin-binding protein 5/6)
VLGAPSESERDLDTLELLDYGFSVYRRKVPIREGRELASPSIRYSGGELPLVAARTARVGLRRGQGLQVAVRAPDEVEGPIRRGRRLGQAIVYVDGRRATTVPLIASRSVEEASAFDKARSFVEDHLIVLALALCVILVAVTLLVRARFRREEGEEVTGLSREQRRIAREERRRERVGGGK